MWTEAKALTSLLEWSQVIGIHPYLIAQINEPRDTLSNSFGQCENVFFQYAHQSADHLSREEVAQALAQAEQLISNLTGTYVAPLADSETVLYPRSGNLFYRQIWYGASGRIKPIRAKVGNLISMGRPTDTLLEADVAITPSDPFSNGFNTQFTLSVAVPNGTLASEIVCTFSDADSYGFAYTDLEIKPLRVTISGNTATITGEMVQVVTIDNYLPYAPSGLNANNAIYASTLDVYRRTVDLAQSGTLIYDNVTSLCDDPPCTFDAYSACFYAADKRGGWVVPVPGQYDDDTAAYSRLYPQECQAPDRVTMNYVAGIPRDSWGRVAEPWRGAVAKLATALLPNKTCGCAHADTRLFYYRSLPLREDGMLEVTQTMLEMTTKHFGVTGRGAVEAMTLLYNQNLINYRSAHA